MPVELILTNIGYTLSIITTIAIAFIVFFRSEQRKLKIIFILLSAALATFEISHVLAINISDPVLSRSIMMWNVSNIFIITLDVYFVYYIIGITKKRLFELGAFCITGLFLFFIYLFNPSVFLKLPSPKLYLLNYYNPGILYFLMLILLGVGFVMIMYNLIRAFLETNDIHEKKRFKYYIIGHLFGYGFGLTAHLLSYNISFDPIWSVFLGFYTLFFAYAMIQYDLLDIHVVAKNALVYAFIAVIGGAALTVVSYANVLVAESVPGFPTWILPLLGSSGVVVIAEFVFWKIKEVDLLKYEFINIVTHKFRTPLTYITWSTDNLRTTTNPEEIVENVKKIEAANARLVELTDVLVSTANSENKAYLYEFRMQPLENIVQRVIASYSDKIKEKNITVHFTPQTEIRNLFIDLHKIEFALQIIFENAIVYNVQNGIITITIEHKGKKTYLRISDSGLGIPEKELPYIFNKFFRSDNARRQDTEGLGLGLYIAKNIIDRHGAKISVTSDGENKGTTFTIVFKR